MLTITRHHNEEIVLPILRHWERPDDATENAAVKKSMLTGTKASLTRVAIKAGTKAERHSHSFEQFVQVISGSGKLETKEGIQSFSAGHVFHFLPDTWHAAVFEEDTVLVETNLEV
jgi:quercetin dioxygenase-like cupin family protein